jgi:hypothetical protein
LQENGAVLKQGAASATLGAANDLSAVHQHFAAHRLGKTPASHERRRANPPGDAGVDSQGFQSPGQEQVDFQVCRSKRPEPGARRGDRVGQLPLMPYGTTPGGTPDGVHPKYPDAVGIVLLGCRLMSSE